MLCKGLFVLVTAAMFGMFLFNSCMSGNAQPASAGTINNNLIGVWEKSGGNNYISFERFVFFDNGTYLGGSPGRYSIYNDVLMTVNVGRDSEYANLYTFSISGGTLTLLRYGSPEEQKTTYKKVK